MLLERCKTIDESAASVLATLWDMDKWKAVWPSMVAVDYEYNDGANQAIIMTVSRDGQLETNRTIRFLINKNHIRFFSPQPPPDMTFHRGDWCVEPTAQNRCTIKAIREYDLIKHRHETSEDYKKRRVHFHNKFSHRLDAILNTFKNYIEKDI